MTTMDRVRSALASGSKTIEIDSVTARHLVALADVGFEAANDRLPTVDECEQALRKAKISWRVANIAGAINLLALVLWALALVLWAVEMIK